MICVFETKLQTWDENLNITRNVQIPSTATLAELGYLLLTVYGAQGYHLFDFTIGRTTYGCDEESSDKPVFGLTVGKAFTRTKKAVFSYDYGDGWTFDVKLVDKFDAVGCETKLISGTGRGIIEDVGGTGGLEAFIEAFKKCKGEEYRDYCDWLGIKHYDAETCKVGRINEMLSESIAAMAEGYESGGAEDVGRFKEWFEDQCASVRRL